ncbi:MAG: hypothetical protein KatS3mg058_3136 [Roseiflexus sp.]|nr:MAG: hypothetical protein KatS3mg058_3136 [Roseiflexus sp.]
MRNDFQPSLSVSSVPLWFYRRVNVYDRCLLVTVRCPQITDHRLYLGDPPGRPYIALPPARLRLSTFQPSNLQPEPI